MDRNRVVLEEAEAWRLEERISPEFHDWVKKRYSAPGDAGTARILQRVLLTVASVLVFVGIFTLVAQFWSDYTDGQKFGILLFFVVLSLGLGFVLAVWPATRLLSFVLMPLALPLYLFAMSYVDHDFGAMVAADTSLSLIEGVVVIAGVGLCLGVLAAGLRGLPTFAVAAPPSLLGVLMFLASYAGLEGTAWRALFWSLLAVNVTLHAFLLASWYGFIGGAFWRPLPLRLALAANVPWGFALILMMVDQYSHGGPLGDESRFDAVLVQVPLVALYMGILLGFSLRLGQPELTATSGIFLIFDAIYLGESKGGLFGAVGAIFAAAVVLIILAQQGVLGRIFKPRPPPHEGPEPKPATPAAAAPSSTRTDRP